MTDIVDRLGSGKLHFAGPLRVLLDEAKDEIALLRDEMAALEAEVKRLREQLEAADEHAQRLEAVVEKMTVWEPSKGGRLG